jgi:capsular exopolysaccharide synthesis family protein
VVIDQLDLSLDVADVARAVEGTFVANESHVLVRIEGLPTQEMLDIVNTIPLVFNQQQAEEQDERLMVLLESLQQQQAYLQTQIDDVMARLQALSASPGTAQDASQDDLEEERLQALLQGYRNAADTIRNVIMETERQLALPTELRLPPLDSTANRYLSPVLNRPYAEVISAQPRTTVQIISSPPPLQRYVVIAVLVGTLIALVSGFVFELFDDRVRMAEQAERLTGLPVLAEIEAAPEVAPVDLLVTAHPSTSASAEAYRLLLVRVGFSALDCPFQTLLVTRSDAYGSTTAAAANLALALAQMGRRVLLVDMQVRQPVLHRCFGQPNERGVSTLVADTEHGDIAASVLPTGIDNLHLLPAGPPLANPGEIFTTQRMVDLVAQLKHQADVVVLDSPPLLHTSDALLLARLCDATLLVVQTAATRASGLKRAREHLVQSGVQVPGILVNMAPRAQRLPLRRP